MTNQPFGDADRREVERWAREQLKQGKSLRAIKREAREKFAAFDWTIVLNILMEIIKAWLSRK